MGGGIGCCKIYLEGSDWAALFLACANWTCAIWKERMEGGKGGRDGYIFLTYLVADSEALGNALLGVREEGVQLVVLQVPGHVG